MKLRFSGIITWLVLLFFHLPLLSVVIGSFNQSRVGGTWGGWTLHWYYQLFQDKAMWQAIYNSLSIACCSTIIATLLGTCAAFAVHLFKSKWQTFNSYLLFSPLIVPEIHIGISLLLLFVIIKLPLGIFSVFLAHTCFCISYVGMIMLARLEGFDFKLIEAALDLGAKWPTIFKRILLPLLKPGLFSAAILAFTLSIDDFVITFFVSGPSSTTVPLHIYSMIKFGTPPLINALSTCLLFLTVILVTASQKFSETSNK